METAIYRHLSDMAKEYGLLPEGQMDNRIVRLTELAIRIVTETVYMVWQHSVIASLLQLDIKGAFDTINHIRLLDISKNKGFPI